VDSEGGEDSSSLAGTLPEFGGDVVVPVGFDLMHPASSMRRWRYLARPTVCVPA
jgi:hypothetical protein